MYNFIKKRINHYFPGLINRHEATLRKILVFFYKGDKVQCTICGNRLQQFIQHHTGDLCPGCGSLGRHRRLWSVLGEQVIPRPNEAILHFSPSKVIQRKLKKEFPHYTSTDYEGGLHTDKALDITKIDEPDNTYHMIICFHVLEHITEDHKAIAELYRILKPGGKAIIQTPFKEGEIYEDFSVTDKDQRKACFGQEDHVRVYSVEGLKERLKAGFFDVDVLSYQEDPDNRFGFKTEEYILVARKPD